MMYVLMCFQTALMTGGLTTHLTTIRVLNNMSALMSYHIALMAEYPISHCTNKMAITTMYALMYN
jgi:hypothetical protein